MADLIGFDSALERIVKAARPLGVQSVPLAEAEGRYTAAAVTARITQPPFDASAMDGYAVRAAEVAAGRAMPVAGVAQAGTGFSGPLPAGAAARIFTGAPVPAGADSVIMQEEATVDGTSVSFGKVPQSGQSIRKRGQDFAGGDVLLDTGAPLTPIALSLAAAGNNATLSVHRRPTCVLVSTGDELVAPGAGVGSDQIVSSNGFGLAAMFARAGASVRDRGIVGDDQTTLKAALEGLLKSDADVVITCGGASVGDHDLVRPTFEALGVEMGFWKIAMRPGKPLMFGRFGEKLVFGLPGNPVSALTTAFLLIVPALKALAGAADPRHRLLTLPLATALPANGSRRHFLRAAIEVSGNGSAVRPMSQTDSAHLSSFARADALVVHREHAAALEAGAPAQLILL